MPYSLIPQVMSATTSNVLRVAPRILQCSSYFELNCGCPTSRVVGHGAGSSILQDPSQFAQRVEDLTLRLGAEQIAIKMRIGFNSRLEFENLFAGIKNFKLAHLAIHGRSRQDQYLGSADWDVIRTASNASQAKVVIGSGDIIGVESYAARVKTCSFKTIGGIGRGAIRNPWIFAEIRSEKRTTLSRPSFLSAMRTLAGVLKLYYYARPHLRGLVESGAFFYPCGADLNKWQSILTQLNEAIEKIDFQDAKLERLILGRLKQFATYFPGHFFSTDGRKNVLRSQGLEHFFSNVERELLTEILEF